MALSVKIVKARMQISQFEDTGLLLIDVCLKHTHSVTETDRGGAQKAEPRGEVFH